MNCTWLQCSTLSPYMRTAVITIATSRAANRSTTKSVRSTKAQLQNDKLKRSVSCDCNPFQWTVKCCTSVSLRIEKEWECSFVRFIITDILKPRKGIHGRWVRRHSNLPTLYLLLYSPPAPPTQSASSKRS